MKKFALLLFALMLFFLFQSCEEDIEKRQVTFIATMPADDLSSLRPGSIINGVPDGEEFNLNAQWKDGDKIQIFVRQDGMLYQVENPAIVSDISSDGKTCSLLVTLPKKVNRDKGYDIIGVTGVEAYIDGEDVVASCALTRVGIDGNGELLLPMWFTAKKGSNQAKFHHLCAYEVLYVNNSTETTITFKHGGFEVITPWYKYSDKAVIANSSRIISSQEGQAEAESNGISVDAWGAGAIVTWYVPRFDIIDDDTPGASIDNARLKAYVNGNAVTTVDALKAHKHITRGNAYYMQITWDGSNLYFSNDYCPDGNHPHMIDLGLPSGTKWACCNVGANTPAECGGYFAWGETTPKSVFGLTKYKWYANGDDHNILKYCCNSDYGTVDNKTELDLEDDAAYVNWGPQWRMSSLRQFYELMRNCTSEWAKVNGMGGYVFKSKTNNSAVFFPLAGWNPRGVGLDTYGNYWSHDYDHDIWPHLAFVMCIEYGNTGAYAAYLHRYYGASIRATNYKE